MEVFRIRPTNFPTVRIAQLAALFNKSTDFIGLLIDTEDVQELFKYFKQPVSEYCKIITILVNLQSVRFLK